MGVAVPAAAKRRRDMRASIAETGRFAPDEVVFESRSVRFRDAKKFVVARSQER
jgi:hypothetical protein